MIAYLKGEKYWSLICHAREKYYTMAEFKQTEPKFTVISINIYVWNKFYSKNIFRH